MRIWFLLGAFLLLLVTGSARAQSNLALMISQSGDYIGQGQTYVTTNQSDLTLSGSAAQIQLTAFGYYIYFSGPGGTNLAVGTYTNAARWPFNGGSPGLSIFGNGRGCNNVCGSFQILELHTDGSGNVDRFWVTFTHICECSMAPMTGELRYNSALAPAVPASKTIRVPADYATIQSAINASSLLASDTVLVSPGTYNEAINFNGKRTVLASSGGPGVTILNTPSGNNGVTFSSGETATSTLSGFTIMNASTGVYVSSASPTIMSNVIVNCGTGVNCNFASPTVRNNQIVGGSGNAVYINGAASALIDSNIIRTNHGGIGMFAAGSPTIRNNLLQGNIGDAMGMVNQSDANIIQNVIVGNTGNGITWLVPSGARGPYVINNTIANNGGAGISADGYDAGALIANNIIAGAPALNVGTFNDVNPPVILYNDIYATSGLAYAGAITNLTGVAGNISTNALFVCLPTDDYHLLASSPCIDAGSNGVPLVPGQDYDGGLRIRAGGVAGTTVDLGAYEFNPAFLPSPCLYVYVPSNIVVTAAAGQSAVTVNYPAPTGPPVAAITSTPPSGSSFPGGTNIVTCTATYGSNSVSATFKIIVYVPPAITSVSASTNIPAGSTLNLSVVATGAGPLGYRWFFENVTLPGATNPVVSIANIQAANEGIYRVVVTNLGGATTSGVVSVRVSPAPPSILTNPAPLTLPASSNAIFAVTAAGSQPISYQWLFNGNVIGGANLAQYSLAGIQSSNSGNYQVLVANSVGSVTSQVATLTVTPLAPYFTVNPAGASVSAGSNRTFTSSANGTLPIAYQWQHASTNLPGAILSSLTLSNLVIADAGTYAVIASNSAGFATSAPAVLTVFQSPTFLQALTNQVVDISNNAVLAVSVLGSPTLNYSWQFNGVSISATNPILVISNIQPSQSGYYRVSVTNQFGSLASTGRISVMGLPSRVLAWGDNSGGQTNVPSGFDDIVAIAGGDYHTAALHRDGTLAAWGYNGDGQATVPTNTLRFVSIASGASHNLAITEKGTVIAWGRNEFGQTNVPASASNNVLSVAAGDSHSLALLASRTVVAWGDNTFGQTTVPQGLSGVRAIAAGRNHNLAVRTNGTIAAWGYNISGQATAPSGLTNVAAVAAGYLHSVVLLSNSTVVAWGDNTFGQTNVPAGLSNVVAIAAGDFHSYALLPDGSIVGWGDDSYRQLEAPVGLTNVLTIASGNYHGLALVPVAPYLQTSIVASRMIIRWGGPGVLQWAPSPTGPFSDMQIQGRIYTNTDMSLPAKFFRLRP